jgi:hypothetical protein
MVLYDSLKIPYVPDSTQPYIRKGLEFATYGGAGYLVFLMGSSILKKKYCMLDYTDIIKDGRGVCPVLDIDDNNNEKLINTMGLLIEEIVIRHEISAIKLTTVNVLGNVLTYGLMVIALVILIYYIFKSVYEWIKSKLNRFSGVLDKIEKMYEVITKVIQVAIEAIKKVIDQIKAAIDKLKFF